MTEAVAVSPGEIGWLLSSSRLKAQVTWTVLLPVPHDSEDLEPIRHKATNNARPVRCCVLC